MLTFAIMPNRNVHIAIGAGAGLSASAYYSKDRPAFERFVELLAGIIAGVGAARLPDILDPPTTPNHRGRAHGVVQSATVFSWLTSNIPDWQDQLRSKAKELARSAEETDSLLDAVLLLIGRILLLAASGAIPGFVAGYVSHLAADATTPKSLPLV